MNSGAGRRRRNGLFLSAVGPDTRLCVRPTEVWQSVQTVSSKSISVAKAILYFSVSPETQLATIGEPKGRAMVIEFSRRN